MAGDRKYRAMSMAELEDEFHVLSSLEEWFVRAFVHTYV